MRLQPCLTVRHREGENPASTPSLWRPLLDMAKPAYVQRPCRGLGAVAS
jgi:hypothetical protein